jgi:hypothetical protein
VLVGATLSNKTFWIESNQRKNHAASSTKVAPCLRICACYFRASFNTTQAARS